MIRPIDDDAWAPLIWGQFSSLIPELSLARRLILGQDRSVNDSTTVLFQGAADEARRIESLLGRHGIKSQLSQPPGGCGTG